MDKREHGLRLKAAMARNGYDRQVIADATGVQPRTVTNWTSGTTMPSPRELDALVRLLGEYAPEGGADDVEAAVRRSPLIRWRQNAVLSEYERHLHEQQATEGVRDA